MATDWIKVEVTMPDKPEVVRMAAFLGIDQDAVAGKLLRIWVWANLNLVDGNAVSVTGAFIDRLTMCQKFAEALANVGWLRENDGGLLLPNFDRHNGSTAKKRALTNLRVDAHRTVSKREEPAHADHDARHGAPPQEAGHDPSDTGKTCNAANVTKALPERAHASAPTRDARARKAVEVQNLTSTPEATPKIKVKPSRAFDEFWAAYPKKKSKGAAAKVWARLKPDAALAERIVRALNIAKRSRDWVKEGGRYVPHPATWLNNEGWEDDVGGGSGTLDIGGEVI